MKVIIQRNKPSDKQTLGELELYCFGFKSPYETEIIEKKSRFNLLFTCKTLELPYKDNQKNISSIPAGIYQCKKGRGWKIPYLHIHILNVPNRTGIRIHRANRYKQLKGCGAVGESFTDMDNDGYLDVTNSRKTLNKLLDILPDRFELEIRDHEE
jgi:hypothetical protein